jgi:hypothetical protein
MVRGIVKKPCRRGDQGIIQTISLNQGNSTRQLSSGHLFALKGCEGHDLTKSIEPCIRSPPSSPIQHGGGPDLVKSQSWTLNVDRQANNSSLWTCWQWGTKVIEEGYSVLRREPVWVRLGQRGLLDLDHLLEHRHGFLDLPVRFICSSEFVLRREPV